MGIFTSPFSQETLELFARRMQIGEPYRNPFYDSVIVPTINFIADLPWMGEEKHMSGYFAGINMDAVTHVTLYMPNDQKLKFEKKDVFWRSWSYTSGGPAIDSYHPNYADMKIDMVLGSFEIKFNSSRWIRKDESLVELFGVRGERMAFHLDADMVEIERLSVEVAELKAKVTKNENDIKKLKEKKK